MARGLAAIVLFIMLSSGLLSGLPSFVQGQTDLTQLTPQQADALIIKIKGRWVLESIGSRPVRGDCVEQLDLQFSSDHFVTVTNCNEGQTSQKKQHWEVTSNERHETVLKIEGEKNKTLSFKDDGRPPAHQYRMRLRPTDITDPKGELNTMQDYKLVPSRNHD